MSAPAPSGYRPALDGLRALAIVGVVFYHLGYRWIPGGFLGVDVFFVLSGYLITTLLISDLDGGRIRFARFWAQRARRLLPAVLLLCLVIATVVRWLTPFPQWTARRDDALAVMFYVMNWHLLMTDQDYFARYFGVSPLRHAWSLAIEEQFYILWPVILASAAALMRRSKAAIATTVVICAAASAISMLVFYDPSNPSRAYYGTDTRAQQLLVGAALATAMNWRPGFRQDRGRVLDIVALFSLLIILVAFGIVTDTWGGYYRGGALLLSIGVAVLVWAIESRQAGIVSRIFAVPPIRWVGTISYGLYLWHWPVILFAGTALAAVWGPNIGGVTSNSTVFNLLRILLAVAIATSSYYLLEQPIRRASFSRLRLTDRRVFAVAPAALLAGSYAVFLLTAQPSIAGSVEPGEYACPASGRMCIRHAGSSSSRPVVALVGDSTARSLDVGIMALSEAHDWTYVFAAQNGCSLIDRPPVDGTNPPNNQCPIENVAVRNQLLDDYRPTVIIGMDRNMTTDYISESGQRVAAASAAHLSATEVGLDAAAAALTARGAILVLIETLPPGLPLDCGERQVAGTSCTEHASSDLLAAEYGRIIETVAARHPEMMRAVSVTSLVCPADSCSPQVDGTILRYDRVHFTKSGARWLAPRLYDLLEGAGLRDRLR